MKLASVLKVIRPVVSET
uniref:Uncharacterized protein n=1 Tax=Arundo donax TaxID=35708 RepID=A0A0A9BYT6_ARUDO